MQVSLTLPGAGMRLGLPWPGAASVRPAPADVGALLADAVTGVLRRAADGTAAEVAAGRLLSRSPADLDAFATRVAGALEAREGGEAREGPEDGLAAVIYGCAAAGVMENRDREAGIGLAALLEAPGARPLGLLGLAVCALRAGQVEDALTLALESCKPDVGHPRAYCVAGLCELKRGNRRAAQTYLSGASRLARREADGGEDLRLAQQVLLLMHMSSAEDLDRLLDVKRG